MDKKFKDFMEKFEHFMEKFEHFTENFSSLYNTVSDMASDINCISNDISEMRKTQEKYLDNINEHTAHTYGEVSDLRKVNEQILHLLKRKLN